MNNYASKTEGKPHMIISTNAEKAINNIYNS